MCTVSLVRAWVWQWSTQPQMYRHDTDVGLGNRTPPSVPVRVLPSGGGLRPDQDLAAAVGFLPGQSLLPFEFQRRRRVPTPSPVRTSAPLPPSTPIHGDGGRGCTSCTGCAVPGLLRTFKLVGPLHQGLASGSPASEWARGAGERIESTPTFFARFGPWAAAKFL